MPYTPPPLRGAFYSTALYARCHRYSYCPSCMCCAARNDHDAACRVCEGIKPPHMRCRCTPDKKLALVQLEEKMNRPMFDVNGGPKKVDLEVMSTALSQENEKLAARMMPKELTKEGPST